MAIYLATPRIQKPGEGNIYRYLARQGADGLLVRNAGGIAHCTAHEIPFVADFSVNAANELAVDFFRARGCPAGDGLLRPQLRPARRPAPGGPSRPGCLEVVIHQQIPMFHMEHCVFCAFLSPGTDKTNCGRPCDHHDVKLRDRVGMEHPLKADVGCRNTLYNAVPQTAAEYLPRLLARGVRATSASSSSTTHPPPSPGPWPSTAEAIAGRRDPKTLWRDLKATGKYGVTRGALAIL